MAETVLILGSGPNATNCRDWDLCGFDAFVVINNAWRVRPDWTHLIHPEDFPKDRHPLGVTAAQEIVTARDYVPCQNAWGGFVYAGGTMAFTAGYWVLEALKPRVMAYLGCDMVYPNSGKTHFYGTGEADPLRDDPTLQSLEAKSARLALLAASAGCACVNLSAAEDSRLVFARSDLEDLGEAKPVKAAGGKMEDVLRAESELGYMAPSGRYWDEIERFDPSELSRLDAMWLTAWSAAQ